MNKKIARNIILAQIASDGGKGYRYFKGLVPKEDVAYLLGYDIKDDYILDAINMINRHGKSSGFSYYIGESDIDSWNESAIVYFNFKIDGKRYQVSFHTFGEEIISRRYEKKNDTHSTRWDKASSRRAAMKLVEVTFNKKVQN